MILTFSKESFKDKILSGSKIHTIRADKKNRWKPGMKIHFWMHNPRNVKKNPYQFAEGICNLVLPISIYPSENRFEIGEQGGFKWMNSLNELAVNDGFEDWKEMKTLFTNEFHGRIIYWDLNILKI